MDDLLQMPRGSVMEVGEALETMSLASIVCAVLLCLRYLLCLVVVLAACAVPRSVPASPWVVFCWTVHRRRGRARGDWWRACRSRSRWRRRTRRRPTAPPVNSSAGVLHGPPVRLLSPPGPLDRAGTTRRQAAPKPTRPPRRQRAGSRPVAHGPPDRFGFRRWPRVGRGAPRCPRSRRRPMAFPQGRAPTRAPAGARVKAHPPAPHRHAAERAVPTCPRTTRRRRSRPAPRLGDV